jgi:hypothetical protein
MTEPHYGGGEPSSPFGDSPQPFHVQSSGQQQGSRPPARQHDAVLPGVRRVETKSPWVALVCGVLSLTGGLPFLGGLLLLVVLQGILATLAVVFGQMGRREAPEGRTSERGMATAGLVLGIAGLVRCAYFLWVFAALSQWD